MADAPMNHQILLVSRPEVEASTANFKLVETPLAPLKEGELRVRNHFLSLDPYMRGRMSDTKCYTEPQPMNEVMVGGTVGEVIESHNASFKAGDTVVSIFGWQEYGTSEGKGLTRSIPPACQ